MTSTPGPAARVAPDGAALAAVLRAVAVAVLERPAASRLPPDPDALVAERTPMLLAALVRFPVLRRRAAVLLAEATPAADVRALAAALLHPDDAVARAAQAWLAPAPAPAAERAAERAERRADRAARRADELQKRLREARGRLEYAKRDAATATRRLAETRDALAEADAALAEQKERADGLNRRLAAERHLWTSPRALAAALLTALEHPTPENAPAVTPTAPKIAPVPSNDVPPTKVTPTASENAPSELKDVPAALKGAPAKSGEMLAASKGVPSELKDVPAVVKEAPAKSGEAVAALKDVPAVVKDVPARSGDALAASKGLPAASEDVPTVLKGGSAVSKVVPAGARDAPAGSGEVLAASAGVSAGAMEVPAISRKASVASDGASARAGEAVVDVDGALGASGEVPVVSDGASVGMVGASAETVGVSAEVREVAAGADDARAGSGEVPVRVDDLRGGSGEASAQVGGWRAGSVGVGDGDGALVTSEWAAAGVEGGALGVAARAVGVRPDEVLGVLRALAEPLPRPVVVTAELGLRVVPLGGDDHIGGSCVLVEAGGTRILIDAGLRPGDRAAPPRDIARALDGPLEAVVVTHAHNDHCGYVPALIARRSGLRVVATPETVALMPVMWADTAKVMAARERGRARWGADAAVLYGPREVDAATRRREALPLGEQRRIGALTVELFPAGHVLGAAGVVVRAGNRRVVVTGDISGFRQETVGGYAVPESARGADLLVMESTCCAEEHDARDLRVDELVRAVAEVYGRGGRVLIPAFALGRAQEIALILRRRLPDVPVRVDGMAADLAAVFESLDPEIRIFAGETAAADRPAELDGFRTGVVISTSGMLTGGPVVEWARRVLPEPGSALFISGYQDEESPGRALLELASSGGAVTLPDRDGEVTIPVRARVETMRLSAHADRRGLLDIASEIAADETMLVHGVPKRQRTFAATLGVRGHRVAETAAWRPAGRT
ncbi:MBL fold metallo-hydrolase [Actinomadura decatromicini]|uniref:MBL fold metallo-hydrolase n=1 Tax=Actinomadura decatromicini TaxID=2604572 RepID=A0A5D3FCL6_9ACTN|nr:MBL fold metallo-hydrolase [Actinomadura decatromicini]TYK45782.1 MBL fold metallo-hydrolase [Actinomadura decatromicini]